MFDCPRRFVLLFECFVMPLNLGLPEGATMASMMQKSSTLMAARPFRALIALCAVLSLFATACGSESATQTTGDSNPAEAETQAVPEAEAQGRGEADAADSSVPSSETKTLDEYLGSLSRVARGPGGGGGGGADDAAAEQAQVQVEIQRCMQAQGFEYVPEESTGGLLQFLAQTDQGLSAEDFAETKGFGISTRFDEVLDGDVVLEADSADPNDEYLATLSETEADAWQFALRGAPIERNVQGQQIDPDTGEVLAGGGGRRGPTGGCSLEASTIVRGDRSAIDALAEEFDELDARINADPRIAEIARDWASCIRDAGFAYENVDEARTELRQEFRPLIRQIFGRGGGQGQGQADLSDLSLSPEQEVELGQLQDREIAIAVASLECDGGTDAEVAAIEARYEAEFVEANRETLESISSS